MRNFLPVSVLVSFLFLGCIPSLHPLYTAHDLLYKTALIGTWQDDDGDTWTFTHQKDKTYTLIYTEDDAPAAFDAHLVQLGDFLFLDTYPKEPEIKNNYYLFHLVAAHLFARVWFEQDSIKYALLSVKWLEQQFDYDPEILAHEDVDNSFVLTASTTDLQKFMLQNADNTDAFSDVTTLRRIE